MHKAEELLAELSGNYPSNIRSHSVLKQDSQLASCAPELLRNTPDRLLIWVPRLPSKSRGTKSLSYIELQELLWENSFAHFEQWHCSFIHTYHPKHCLGVLDVDNYYYKPIIDRIARALRTSDSFCRFSCSMYNYASEKLKPGCYIHISKNSEKVGNFEDFVLSAIAENGAQMGDFPKLA